MDADTYNDETRHARQSLTETERAQGCGYPLRPCDCGTCDMTGEI